MLDLRKHASSGDGREGPQRHVAGPSGSRPKGWTRCWKLLFTSFPRFSLEKAPLCLATCASGREDMVEGTHSVEHVL